MLEVNGTRHPLQPPGLVIGRGSEADLRINDPGNLAGTQIRVNPAGQGLIDIVDLGSTNGIMVNGQKVRRPSCGRITDRDRVHPMLVHAPGGR